mmetsp:Transcript_37175/g.68847  ORF Transcript_37175/g.68847 Transcript_37175/m.68847 type:complete len:85 (-) Transcript_37175:129-383(-)
MFRYVNASAYSSLTLVGNERICSQRVRVLNSGGTFGDSFLEIDDLNAIVRTEETTLSGKMGIPPTDLRGFRVSATSDNSRRHAC